MSQKSWRIETCSGSVTAEHCWRQHQEALQLRPQMLLSTCLLGPAFSFSGLCFILVLHRSYLSPSPPILSLQMPHLNRLWDRFCGSNINGGAGILSWQGIRFLLNRLQKDQSKKSYFPSNSLHGEAQNQESLSQKSPQSFHSGFFLGRNSPSNFLELNYMGFAWTLQVRSRSSQTHKSA